VLIDPEACAGSARSMSRWKLIFTLLLLPIIGPSLRNALMCQKNGTEYHAAGNGTLAD